MFCDLNLPRIDGDPHLARERVAMAVQLGWSGVATTHAAADRLTEKDRQATESSLNAGTSVK